MLIHHVMQYLADFNIMKQYSEQILFFFDKAFKIDTYPKAEVNVALSILQAGIDRRVQIHTVDIDGKVKINAVSNDIFEN